MGLYMPNALTFALLFLMSGAVFYVAPDLAAHGNPWARDLCLQSYPLCAHPEWLGFAAIAIALMHILVGARR
jgi:hypothetical protein